MFEVYPDQFNPPAEYFLPDQLIFDRIHARVMKYVTIKNKKAKRVNDNEQSESA